MCRCLKTVPPPVQVAINNEVLAAMSNKNYASPGGMLDTWMAGVKRSGVKNAMVIALDPETKANAQANGLTAHEMHIPVRLGDNLGDKLATRLTSVELLC